MGRRRTFASLLACTLVALLVAAPTASAKPGYVVFPGGQSMELSLKGSHGYEIEVDKEDRSISLSAYKDRSSVVYSVRTSGSEDDRIEARFPGVGRVSVRFRPEGPPRERAESFPGCRGGETVEQRGYFVGTIRFRGERGYTSVDATRARGATKTTKKGACKRSTFDDNSELEKDSTELWAYSRSSRRAVGFYALHTVIPSITTTTLVGALVAERRRGMAILRDTFASLEKSPIFPGDTRPNPLSATVTPPAPFHGSAEYLRTPEGERTWTGTLAASLPGLGRVALAGPSFSARLCQHSGCHPPGIDGVSLTAAQRRGAAIRSIRSGSSRWLSRTNSASGPESGSRSSFRPR